MDKQNEEVRVGFNVLLFVAGGTLAFAAGSYVVKTCGWRVFGLAAGVVLSLAWMAAVVALLAKILNRLPDR